MENIGSKLKCEMSNRIEMPKGRPNLEMIIYENDEFSYLLSLSDIFKEKQNEKYGSLAEADAAN